MKETLDKIRGLKWIKSASYDSDGNLSIITKPDVLKTVLTHYYIPKSDERYMGGKLPKPIVVKLPSYDITLTRFEDEEIYDDDMDDYTEATVYEMELSLVKPPKKLQGSYGRLHPTSGVYEIGSMGLKWGRKQSVCLGAYKVLLGTEDNDYERVLIVGQFLQCAIPDMGGTRNRTQWAYSVGLVGDEIIQPAKAPKKIQ